MFTVFLRDGNSSQASQVQVTKTRYGMGTAGKSVGAAYRGPEIDSTGWKCAIPSALHLKTFTNQDI